MCWLASTNDGIVLGTKCVIRANRALKLCAGLETRVCVFLYTGKCARRCV